MATNPSPPVKDLKEIFAEIERQVIANRQSPDSATMSILDFRRAFDQESAKMNQAIFNDQHELVHDTCLRTVSMLMEILSRS